MTERALQLDIVVVDDAGANGSRLNDRVCSINLLLPRDASVVRIGPMAHGIFPMCQCASCASRRLLGRNWLRAVTSLEPTQNGDIKAPNLRPEGVSVNPQDFGGLDLVAATTGGAT